jgi:hypothetical protein
LKNKQEKNGLVICTKARLVAQDEGMYYEATFVSVSRLKAIHIFIEYASFHDFMFFNCIGCSTTGFQTPTPNHMYLLHKALYGIKQSTGSLV